MGKRQFKYVGKDGEVETDASKYEQEDPEFHLKVIKAHSSFLTGLAETERQWRNAELGVTDRLMLSDSTYNGQSVKGSSLETEILEYRRKLRLYNLTTDERPVRPDWFTG